MPLFDTVAARRTLERLRPKISGLHVEPERIREVAPQLSRLASKVTAACEVAFLALTDTAAA